MNEAVFISKKCKNIINITSIITLHYFEFPKSYVFPGESHDFWELLYVDKGEFIVTTDQEHHLKQGDIIFHKPNEFHDNKSYNHIPANVFVLSFVCNSKLMKFFECKKFHLPKQYRKLIGNMIETGKLTYESSFNDIYAKELIQRRDSMIGGQQLIRIYLEQLLIMLLQDDTQIPQKNIFQNSEEFDDMLINEIITILKDNIYNTISIPELCKRMNYSKTYLSIFFKNKTNQTIIEYYRYLKVEEAKVLLRQQHYSITEISQQLCFSTPYYFTNVFKSHTGMAPKEYSRLAIHSSDLH
ncbi:MAG: AraC family transcriptional regulator [Eubacteriales bacterium]